MTTRAPRVLDATAPFGPERRGLTVGLLLAVTANALAALAVVTIAPRIPAELGGLSLYGWLFSGFLLASLLGTVWAGRVADRRGLRAPFAAGLALFAAGLLLAGLAPSMVGVIVARTWQGFGAGAVTTSVYVAITRAYPDAQRARLMAWLSSAWVVPALLGPAVAGVVAEAFGWRWVFLGLVPFLGLVAALTLPRLPAAAWAPQPEAPGRSVGLGAALAVVVGLAVALGALSAVSEWTAASGWNVVHATATIGAVAAGVLVAAAGLTRLLPSGTLRLAPGLPALIAARGAFFGGFIGVEAYLALMLTELHGLSSAATGAVIASGAISWTIGAWWQARRDAAGAGGSRPPSVEARARRVVVGALVLGGGLLAQGAALAGAGGSDAWVVAVAVVGWWTAGFGIGLAHASSSVLAFALAERDAVAAGSVSAALQVAGNVAAAVVAGLAGAALALVVRGGFAGGAAGVDAAALRAGIAAAFAVAWAAWVLSWVASRRTARPAPPPAAPRR